MVVLSGEGWRSSRSRSEWDFPSITLSMDREGRQAMVPTTISQGRAAFAKVFVSDAERQKQVYLFAHVVQVDGRDFGTFRSKPIKVISKPSKMRQASKNLESSSNRTCCNCYLLMGEIRV